MSVCEPLHAVQVLDGCKREREEGGGREGAGINTDG